MIGVTSKRRIALLLLILGATAGAVAPFVHILYPKTAPEKIQLEKDFENGVVDVEYYRAKKVELKEKYLFLGFTNKRRFLFAVGLPISLFVASLFILMASKKISEKKIRIGFTIAGSLFEFTSLYFIVWTVWAYKTGADYPRYVYYLTIILVSVFTTIASRFLINGWMEEMANIKRIFKEDIVEFFVEIKEKHYMRQLKRAISKDLYDKEYQEQVSRDSKEFDKRLYDKAEEIWDK